MPVEIKELFIRIQVNPAKEPAGSTPSASTTVKMEEEKTKEIQEQCAENVFNQIKIRKER